MAMKQSGEDYLEVILLLSQEREHVHQIDIARRANVSQPAVQKAVKLLLDAGYVEMDGLHVRLTPNGEKYAKQVYARHCDVTAFLCNLGVSPTVAEADACQIEHVISTETYQAIVKQLKK